MEGKHTTCSDFKFFLASLPWWRPFVTLMLYKPLCHSYFQSFLPILFLSSPNYDYVGIQNSCYFLHIWSRWVNPFLDCCMSELSTLKYFLVHFHLEVNISPPVFLISFHNNFIDSSEHRENLFYPFFNSVSFDFSLSAALATATLSSHFILFELYVLISDK